MSFIVLKLWYLGGLFMKVYFACSSTDLDKYISHYLAIVNYIISLGFKISCNWLSKVSEEMKNPEYDPKKHVLTKKETQNEGIRSIKESNVLIADVSIPSTSVGYQIFMAIEQGLPVLCLYSLDFGLKTPPQVVRSIDSPQLKISSYSGQGYRTAIELFLNQRQRHELVKFNFVATKGIVDYLDWLSKRQKLTRSAALRSEIEKKLIKSNKKYQEFLRDQL